MKQFEPLLGGRAAYRRYQGQKPFYSMYNVGTYTLAPIKVVWRRMDRRIRAAVVEPVDDPLLGRRPVVPQETCVLVACALGRRGPLPLCGAQQRGWTRWLRAHSVVGGKGFGTPGMLEYLGLRRFEPATGGTRPWPRAAAGHTNSGAGRGVAPIASHRGGGAARGAPYTVKTSCACGTPIAKLLGPPEACRELTAEQEEIDRLAAEL